MTLGILPNRFRHGLENVLNFIATGTRQLDNEDLKDALNTFENDAKSLWHSRKSASGGVEISLATGDVIAGTAENISSGGVGVVVDGQDAQNLLPTGTETRISVVWPGGESLEAAAEVAWSGDDGLIGFVFRGIDSKATETIQRLLLTGIVDRTLNSD